MTQNLDPLSGKRGVLSPDGAEQPFPAMPAFCLELRSSVEHSWILYIQSDRGFFGSAQVAAFAPCSVRPGLGDN